MSVEQNENNAKTDTEELYCSGRYIDDLIAGLTDQLQPVRVATPPYYLAFSWIILAVAYLITMVWALGPRPDVFDILKHSSFVFELSLVASFVLSMAFSSFYLRIPDMQGKNWILVCSWSFLSLFLLCIITHLAMDSYKIPAIIPHQCYEQAVVFGFLPAVAILYSSIKGKTTHPFLLSLMNTLAAGGIGYIGLRLTCPSEDIGHIFFYHVCPFILFTLLGVLGAQRLYRW